MSQKHEISCWKCHEMTSLETRNEFDGCCWACGEEIDLDDYLIKAMDKRDEHYAALSAVTAERDRLLQFEAAHNEWHDKTEWVQKTAKAHELGKHRADVLKERVDQLQAEVEALRKVIRAALYYVPEHKHDLREIMSAAMAAKEA